MTDKDTDLRGERDGGWERNALERVLLASVAEQRRARRWSIFFKLFFAVYLLLLFAAWQSERIAATPAGRYTALVEMEGVIDVESTASADNIISGLRAAFESENAAGVILRVNSPGGSPVQSAYINNEIIRLRDQYPDTPLYAVIGDICASGCYYAVASADKIYASEASIVGSIGVLMDGFGFVDTMKKLGVERRLLTAGEHKGLMDPFSPVNPAERRYVQDLLQDIHRQFIEAVKAGRGEVLKEDKELFSGLVWTGARAQELGLVDEMASASEVARDVIGAEEVVDFTPKRDFFEQFTEQLGVAMARALSGELLARGPQLK